MLTIVIPSRTDRLLHRLLLSLRVSSPGGRAQVIVADNGLSEAMRKAHPDKLFIPVPAPFCFSKAINLAVRHALPRNDIMIMNDDVVVRSFDFVGKLEESLKEAKQSGIGILSPIIRGGVGNQDQGADLKPDEISLTNGPICFVTAIIPRTVWEEIGTLDERFTGYGFEDVDYSRRVTDAGWRLGVTGAGAVFHGDGAHSFSTTFRSQNGQRKLDLMSEIACKTYDRKWGRGPRMGRYGDEGPTILRPVLELEEPISPDFETEGPPGTPERPASAILHTTPATFTFQASQIRTEAPKYVRRAAKNTDIEADIDLLWALVRLKRPTLAVEIGTRTGVSTRAIAAAMRDLPGKFFAVDPDPACKRYVQNIVGCKYIQEWGEQFLGTLDKGVDFFLIDTDPHTYDQTQTWLGWIERLLEPGGIAVFHDVVSNRPEIQVAKAVRDWLLNHPEWSWYEYLVSPGEYRWPQGGLGVLGRPA